MTKCKNAFLSRAARRVVITAALVLVGHYCRVDAGSAWAQLGQSICSVGDNGGFAVGLAESRNGLILAIGSPKYTEAFINQGKVQVHKFHQDSCLWSPHGNPVKGEEAEDQLGTNVVLSCDGSILAVSGDTVNQDDSVRTGFIKLYYYNDATDEWKQKGNTLRPKESATNFGFQLTLTCDGNTVGVGAFGYSEVYTYDAVTSEWKQKGDTLIGTGHMLTALSRDGSTLVVGQRSTGYTSRYVLAYRFQNGVWTQVGYGMDSRRDDDNFPQQLAVSDDGTRIVVRCPGCGNRFPVFQYSYTDGGWDEMGYYDDEVISGNDGTSVVISGNGEHVFTSTNKYDSYHDEVVSSHIWVNGRWIMTGGIHELQHSNINATQILATTTWGSLFAFGITGHDDYDRNRGSKAATTDVGAVYVFYYPDAGIVNDCLPDPDAMSKECEKLQEMEYNRFKPEESADAIEKSVDTIEKFADPIYVTLPDNFANGGGGGNVAGIVIGTVALFLVIALATVTLALFFYKKDSGSRAGQSTQGSSKTPVSNK